MLGWLEQLWPGTQEHHHLRSEAEAFHNGIAPLSRCKGNTSKTCFTTVLTP